MALPGTSRRCCRWRRRRSQRSDNQRKAASETLMTQRPHPGSDRALAGPVMQFSLFEEIERLKAEPDWTAGRRSITLAKQSGLRVVLMVLRAGAKVDEHLT